MGVYTEGGTGKNKFKTQLEDWFGYTEPVGP